MAKVLRCRDVGMAWDFDARAETTHNMRDIPEEVLAKVRATIQDE